MEDFVVIAAELYAMTNVVEDLEQQADKAEEELKELNKQINDRKSEGSALERKLRESLKKTQEIVVEVDTDLFLIAYPDKAQYASKSHNIALIKGHRNLPSDVEKKKENDTVNDQSFGNSKPRPIDID